MGAGRRGGGARAATRTPPTCTWPTRSPRAPGCATPTRCGVLVDEGPGRVNELIALGAVFDADSGGVSSSPARAGTPGPGSCTPAVRPPARRSSARWSTRCGVTAAALYEDWFALDLIVERGVCRGVIGSSPSWATARGACRPRLARHRRRGSALRGHHQPDSMRPATAVAMALRAGGARRRRRVRAVPPDRAAPPGRCHARCSPRRCGATARSYVTRTASGSSTSSRRATWCRGR